MQCGAQVFTLCYSVCLTCPRPWVDLQNTHNHTYTHTSKKRQRRMTAEKEKEVGGQ